MQTAQVLTDLTKVHELSSYELITLWIDRGFTLGLSSNAIQVMTILLRFYNPKKKYVFPTQQTVSERANTSIATVKRALAELINANLILKRRTQRGNIYGFTGALFELLNSSNCTIPTAQNEPCMDKEQIREHNKEQQHNEPEQPKTKNNVVVFSQKSFNQKQSTIALADVPGFIKQNKKVKNPCAYWASLSEEVREELIQKNTEKLEKQRKREEIRQKQEEEKRQYYKDLYDTSKAVNPRECNSWLELGKKIGKIK